MTTTLRGSITMDKEAEGHEFHGNQFTGGKGSTKKEKSKEMTTEEVMHWEPEMEGKGPDISKLSELEAQELSDYVNGAEINAALRGDEEGSQIFEDAHEHAAQLDSIIARDTVKFNGYLYRGTTTFALQDALNGQDLKVGTMIKDKGYVSATKDKRIAEAFSRTFGGENAPVIMRINSLVQIHAIDMNRYHPVYPNQKEVVLPRNSGFRVDGISRKNGAVILEVTHVAP